MIEDLLDTKLNQLKMNSSTLTVPSNTPLGENRRRNPLDVMVDVFGFTEAGWMDICSYSLVLILLLLFFQSTRLLRLR